MWNSAGSQKRPIVEVDICLGPKLIRTHATLSDRSQMTYPFLVGRSVLTGSFTVDTSRSRAAQPVCPALSSLAVFLSRLAHVDRRFFPESRPVPG